MLANKDEEGLRLTKDEGRLRLTKDPKDLGSSPRLQAHVLAKELVKGEQRGASPFLVAQSTYSTVLYSSLWIFLSRILASLPSRC